jgi:DNA-binding IclR family transcriptional regulator
MVVGQPDKGRNLSRVRRKGHPFGKRTQLAGIEAVAVQFFGRDQKVFFAHNSGNL